MSDQQPSPDATPWLPVEPCQHPDCNVHPRPCPHPQPAGDHLIGPGAQLSPAGVTVPYPALVAQPEAPIPYRVTEPPPVLVAYWAAVAETEMAWRAYDAGAKAFVEARAEMEACRGRSESSRLAHEAAKDRERAALEALRAAGVGGGT